MFILHYNFEISHVSEYKNEHNAYRLFYQRKYGAPVPLTSFLVCGKPPRLGAFTKTPLQKYIKNPEPANDSGIILLLTYNISPTIDQFPLLSDQGS